jgi:septal ring factor EnvC (AmiA/AmiB activator)
LSRAGKTIQEASKGGSAGSAAKLKGAFMQIAGVLNTIIDAQFIDTADRASLSAFIQANSGDDGDDEAEGEQKPNIVQPTVVPYEQHSTGIIDLLAEMRQKAEKELNEVMGDEIKRVGAFNLLKQGLVDQSAVDERQKGESQNRLGESTEENAKAKQDLAEATKEHGEQTKYLEDTKIECETTQKEFEADLSDQHAEVEALSKAIEVLSGASDNFSATGSFLQVSQDTDVRDEIIMVLRRAAHKSHNVALAQLALRVKDDPFKKVRGMVEEMIARLQKQQNEEVTKQAWCVSETKKSEAKRDATSSKLEQTQARLEKSKADSAELKENIASLSQKIEEATKNQAEADTIRNKEAALYAELMGNCTSGLSAIAQAIAVLVSAGPVLFSSCCRVCGAIRCRGAGHSTRNPCRSSPSTSSLVSCARCSLSTTPSRGCCSEPRNTTWVMYWR